VGRAEGDRQREGDEEAGGGKLQGHWRPAREAVQDAAHRPAGPGPGQQRAGDLRVRVTVVDENGLPYPGGEIELARERLALHVGRRQVAEEVEPDLPDRNDPALSGQGLEPLPVRFGRRGGEVRMDPRPGGDQARAAGRQLECRFGGGQVVAGDQDPLDAGRQRAVDDLVAVGVEGLVLQVAM